MLGLFKNIQAHQSWKFLGIRSSFFLKAVGLFTTRTPAVPDVFDSGLNVEALRPGRRVGFRSLRRVAADDIYRGHITFVTPTALKLLQLGPNSKRGKLSGDHCRFLQCIQNSIAQSLLFLILVDKIKVVFPIDIIVKETYCYSFTAHIIFVMRVALKPFRLGPNSKQGKLSVNHC